MIISAAGVPRPGELPIAIALADGGRPVPRTGQARIVE